MRIITHYYVWLTVTIVIARGTSSWYVMFLVLNLPSDFTLMQERPPWVIVRSVVCIFHSLVAKIIETFQVLLMAI